MQRYLLQIGRRMLMERDPILFFDEMIHANCRSTHREKNPHSSHAPQIDRGILMERDPILFFDEVPYCTSLFSLFENKNMPRTLRRSTEAC